MLFCKRTSGSEGIRVSTARRSWEQHDQSMSKARQKAGKSRKDSKRKRALGENTGDLSGSGGVSGEGSGEILDTAELLEAGAQLIEGEVTGADSATLVDLADEDTNPSLPPDDELGDTSGEGSLGEYARTTEMHASATASSAAAGPDVEPSGDWFATDTQEMAAQNFDEPSEESAQTQSISEAITGDVSGTYEGSITGSDAWSGEGPSGEISGSSGRLDGPEEIAAYGDVEPREPPASTSTSYDFNDEASGDMLGIILEESREFPELDPDNLPDPTGPLATTGPIGTDELGGDTSQEIDELLGAEVSEAVRQGVKALRRGQRQQAMSSFERALRGDPDDPMAQAYLRLAQELFIRELVPGASLDSVPRLRVGRKMLMTLDLTAEDGAVLALIDGLTSLEGLETMLQHMDRETIYQCLARAQENGLIEFMT